MTAGGGNVSVGANCGQPALPARPSSATRPIRRGDFVLFDMSEKLKKPGAIVADQTWAGYVGETVPEESRKVFNIVREARDAATEFVRAAVREGRSIRGAEVDDVSRGRYRARRLRRAVHAPHRPLHRRGGARQRRATSTTSRRATRAASSRAPASPSSPASTSKASFGVRSEINVYVGERDIEVTGQPVQTEIVPILKK